MGSYSSGFLARSIDQKMAQLRTTTNSFFLGISSQSFKFVGDICLLVVAVIWLGTSAWAEFKGEEGAQGDGDAVEMADEAEKDAEKAAEDKANAAIFAKTIKPLLKERCYDCHKGSESKAKLDLSLTEDDDASGIKGLFSVITKGNTGGSEILKRIKDENDPMPPEGKGEMFSAEEAGELEKWIAAGAPMPDPSIDSEKIVSIVTMLFKGILPIAFILILHYLTGVLFNSGDALIKSTPSQLSGGGLLKAISLILLLFGFAAGTAGIVYGIIDATKGFSDNWLAVISKIGGGILLYLFFVSLARLFLKPAQLNIKIAAGNTAGEEVFGLVELITKAMFKSGPIIYGAALILLLMFEGIQIMGDIDIDKNPVIQTTEAPVEEGFFTKLVNLSKEGENYFKGSSEDVVARILVRTSALTLAIFIPIKIFIYFIIAYIFLTLGRAILTTSRKLGA